jgi:hypothetical protein
MKSTTTCTIGNNVIIALVLVHLALLSCCQGGSYIPTDFGIGIICTCSRRRSHYKYQYGRHLALFLHGSVRPVDDDLSFTDDDQDKKEKKKKRQVEYEQRRQQWMERYGSLEALQSTFGTGADLSPEQTRRLYHALLPRSLLGLYEWELMKPEELAPMAYHARMAAKQYARSRSVWYARAFTSLVDQYRNLRGQLWSGDKHKSPSASMTWEQIWSKYEAQIVREECAEELETSSSSNKKKKKTKEFQDQDLTMRIYLRILEKSCATNQAFDQMFLTTSDNTDELDGLSQVGQQLEQDVREILLGPKESAKVIKKVAKRDKKETKEREKEQEELEKMALQQQEQQEKAEKKRLKELEKQKKTKLPPLAPMEDDMEEKEEAEESNVIQLPSTTKPQSWEVLRILAGTRRKFRRIVKDMM